MLLYHVIVLVIWC